MAWTFCVVLRGPLISRGSPSGAFHLLCHSFTITISTMRATLVVSAGLSLIHGVLGYTSGITYNLVKDYQAGTSNFFNNFNFYTGADPTHGFVQSSISKTLLMVDTNLKPVRQSGPRTAIRTSLQITGVMPPVVVPPLALNPRPLTLRSSSSPNSIMSLEGSRFFIVI
jgi:hypothetical protein